MKQLLSQTYTISLLLRYCLEFARGVRRLKYLMEDVEEEE